MDKIENLDMVNTFTIVLPDTQDYHLRMQLAIEQVERFMLEQLLHRMNGNVTRAAKEIHLTRRGLQMALKRLNIKSEHFKKQESWWDQEIGAEDS